jgi:transcriptional regulator GlxA family with amidase domain
LEESEATHEQGHFGRVAEKEIAFFVYPGFQIQDLSGPLSVFEVAGTSFDGVPYRCDVVSLGGGLVASSSGLKVMTQKIRQAPYDTLIVMGGSIPADPALLPSLPEQLDSCISKGIRRIASVCTGAFILAHAGLLNGRVATTHWKYATRLQKEFPKIKVDSDRIFTKDGGIWTSAGVTAGIDLALALVEEDLGSEVARSVARTLIVYYRRPGNQSQFSAMADMEPESDRIRRVLSYMRENLTQAMPTEQLATVACLSPRQFGRAFLAETGETPAKAVERLRVEAARQRVERGLEPIELIARSVGFVDPERMRRAFIRVTGHPPQSIRRMAAGEVSSSLEQQ